jgi:hypothetical protein
MCGGSVQVEKRRVEDLKEAETRRVEARNDALSTILFYVNHLEDVEELRRRAEAAWGQCDHAQLQARAVRVLEEALARDQQILASVRASEDTVELRRVGVKAARTASVDTLCAMAVQAAAQAGVFADDGWAAADDSVRLKRCLLIAAEEGHVEAVRALLAAGVAVNHSAASNGGTALHAAAANGHAEVIRALLAAGAAVNHADHNGRTALYAAAWNGHVEAIQVCVCSICAPASPARDKHASYRCSTFANLHRGQRTAMQKWRIVILRFGTARQKMVLE